MTATAMIEALGGSGKVAILDHPEVESVILRVKGFESELAAQKKEGSTGIQVVAKLPGGGAKEKSFKGQKASRPSKPGRFTRIQFNFPTGSGANPCRHALMSICGTDNLFDDTSGLAW